jgi:hypothetical protein
MGYSAEPETKRGDWQFTTADARIKLKCLRLSQNFSFWESNLRFRGKNGLWAVFSKAFPKTTRVLGKARLYPQIVE